jgi:DnaJ-domain-containing protein 1
MERENMYKITPEAVELKNKQAHLAGLEAALAERELELTRLQGSLQAFEREYLRVVGVRYAKLDEIEAEIAKYLAFLNPKDEFARKQAVLAWEKAQISKRTMSAIASSHQNSHPGESLKKLYRQVAKRIHPDLATDEVERLRRQKLMALANQAYENGDKQKLEAILHQWEHSPEFVKGEGIAAELIRAIRKIAQVREQLNGIETEINTLRQSALYLLRDKVIDARIEGRDLLAEMAFQLNKKIAKTKGWLEKLRVNQGACA